MNKNNDDELMNIEMKNLKYWSNYYKEKAEKKENILKEFNFDKNDLFQSEECEMMFEFLIEIALKMNLASVDESSYLISLNSLYNEKHKYEVSQFNKTQEFNKLNDDLKKLNLLYEKLKKDYNKLDFDVSNKKENSEAVKQDIEFKQRKIEKYNYEIQKYEEYKQNMDISLTHENILNKYYEILETQKTIEEKQIILEDFYDLPPNIELANERIDQIHLETIQIEKKIEQLLNIIS